jgi:hypothetical protein
MHLTNSNIAIFYVVLRVVVKKVYVIVDKNTILSLQ